MTKNKVKDDGSKWVSVHLDRESNLLLDRVVKVSKRSKRKEAAIRLAHHLKLFGEDWEANVKL